MLTHLYTSPIFFFNDTATTEIYTLSLHDALPIWLFGDGGPISFITFDHNLFVASKVGSYCLYGGYQSNKTFGLQTRSEEHTSELQSRLHLVCRLLLEKKNIHDTTIHCCTEVSSYL